MKGENCLCCCECFCNMLSWMSVIDGAFSAANEANPALQAWSKDVMTSTVAYMKLAASASEEAGNAMTMRRMCLLHTFKRISIHSEFCLTQLWMTHTYFLRICMDMRRSSVTERLNSKLSWATTWSAQSTQWIALGKRSHSALESITLSSVIWIGIETKKHCTMPDEHHKLFNVQASDYAKFRPTYPKELYDIVYEYLGRDHPRCLAVDVATGNGQAACALAECFDKVKMALSPLYHVIIQGWLSTLLGAEQIYSSVSSFTLV